MAFRKLSGLLKAMPDVVQLQDTAGGDFLATLAVKPGKDHGVRTAPQVDLLQASGLASLKYEQSPRRRRQILRSLHRSFRELHTFSRASLVQRLTEEASQPMMSASLVNSYFTLLWHSRAFVVLPGQEEKAAKERSLQLAEHARELSALVGTYEKSVVYKAHSACPELTVTQGVELLGLSAGDEVSEDYVRLLMETGTAPAPRTGRARRWR
jgi:hypothetical protein